MEISQDMKKKPPQPFAFFYVRTYKHIVGPVFFRTRASIRIIHHDLDGGFAEDHPAPASWVVMHILTRRRPKSIP